MISKNIIQTRNRDAPIKEYNTITEFFIENEQWRNFNENIFIYIRIGTAL